MFADGGEHDLAYAEHVLDVLESSDGQAIAPSIWPLEVANVVSRAEFRRVLVESRSSEFLRLLDALAVVVDDETADHALGTTPQLARRFSLSAYAAASLELALREGVPLATLDVELQRAAGSAGVASL